MFCYICVRNCKIMEIFENDKDSNRETESVSSPTNPVKFKPLNSSLARSTQSDIDVRQRNVLYDFHSSSSPHLNNYDALISSALIPKPQEVRFEDEPPLLEELGINLNHIIINASLILNPLKDPDTDILRNSDLAGPIVFSFALGTFLLLAGKFHFGYVYCFGLIGCLAVYVLLNLMSLTGISFYVTASVLGYCQLPLVIFSALAVIFPLKGTIGIPFAIITVLWCATPASQLFLIALEMDVDQQPLLLYPCCLIYGMFSLLILY